MNNLPQVNQMLDKLLAQMQAILGEKLIGVYLYGSLATGDFDPEISDIDLLAAVTSDLDEAEFNALDLMHTGIVLRDAQWDNRIEIAYLSLHALNTFRTESSTIGIISPGEPFHRKEAGKDWLVNWYMVREKGVTLFGVPPGSVIDPISKAEFIQTIKDHMAWWREWIDEIKERPGHSYAILTMCRGLYTCTHGEQVSKLKAAQWAAQELPEWAALINNALVWRKATREPGVDHAASFDQARRFVFAVTDRILKSPP